MKYYIIAGEASGDLHGANLVRAILQRDPEAKFRGFGGDRMVAEGVVLDKHIRELSFMGFLEVVLHIRTILNNLKICKEAILSFQPDVVILVDYPGFNLRIAPFAKALGAKVVYYISPQLWAWKEGRVETIKKYVDEMLVILPFEKDFYARHQFDVDYVGHPLLDEVVEMEKDSAFRGNHQIPPGKIVALLPGSRKQELRRSLPIMLQVAKRFPKHTFIVAGAPSIDVSFYASFHLPKNVKVIHGQTYQILQQADAALVTSGTATLETAFFGVPQVVCYRGSFISYWIARQLVKVKYISLVNLVMDAPLVPERIQSEFNAEQLSIDLKKTLMDQAYRDNMSRGYQVLREKLGGPGASERAATLICG